MNEPKPSRKIVLGPLPFLAGGFISIILGAYSLGGFNASMLAAGAAIFAVGLVALRAELR